MEEGAALAQYRRCVERLASRLRGAQVELGFSDTELARRVTSITRFSVDRRRVGEWSRGTQLPPEEAIRGLESVLQLRDGHLASDRKDAAIAKAHLGRRRGGDIAVSLGEGPIKDAEQCVKAAVEQSFSGTTPIQVDPQWRQDIVEHELLNSRPGDTIRIRQTWIPAPDNFCEALERAFVLTGYELTAQILLMDPGRAGDDEIDLLGARMLLRNANRESARSEILKTEDFILDLQRRVLEHTASRVGHHGTSLALEYGFYRSMPFGPLYQFERRMFVGLYMSSGGGYLAPMLVISPHSEAWHELAQDFSKNWAARRKPLPQGRDVLAPAHEASDSVFVFLTGIDDRLGLEPIKVFATRRMTVQRLLDHLYHEANEFLQKHTYGRDWVLVSKSTGKALFDMGSKWASSNDLGGDDARPLSAVGIRPGDELFAIRLRVTPR